MLELSGFRVLEMMMSNEEIQVYRVERLADHVRMIAKTTSDKLIASDITSAFQYEYEQLLRLKGKGVLVPYGLEMAGERPVLLLHDYVGTTLNQVLHTRRTSMRLEDLLGVAIAAVDCIHQLHQADLILHEITPSYLLVSEDLKEVRLLDLRACQADEGQIQHSMSTRKMDDILPYLSPEQTGRTGMELDTRTDVYSIGVILYEWFALCQPFQSQNALDIVYHHLAIQPEPIYKINRSIPRMVSEIVHKCMEKMPEARYASAYGIRSDLQECLVQYRVSGKVHDFTLAERDVSDQDIVLGALLGRRKEQQTLLQALGRASDGSMEVVWVCGREGMGKTTFVSDTLRKSLPPKSYFVHSTCTPIPNVPPYALWVQVIERLVAHILTVNRFQADVWRERILDAVQGYGSLLVEKIPRLELLISAQQDVSELPVEEAQASFRLVMKRFLQLFMGQDQTLILFFDDLQWIDDASLHFLYDFIDDSETEHVLIVGAYREYDNDVPLPQQRLIKQMIDRGKETEQIRLKSLEMQELQQELGLVLHRNANEMAELAQVLLNKTEGNPLLLKQFLQELLESKKLHYDESSRTWRWDIQQIVEMSVPETVATTLERAEVEFLCTHYASVKDQLQLLLGKSATNMEKAHILIRMIQLEISQNHYDEVIAIGEKALGLLSYRYHFSPSKYELGRQWLRVRRKLRKHPVQSMTNLSTMTDERHITAMTVLADMSDAIYFVNKDAWFYSILLMLEMTLDYGLIPQASHAFSSYALVLEYKFHDYESAYQWGTLACEVAKSEPGLYVQAFTSFALCHESWRRYEPSFLLKYASAAGEDALQSGNIWRANYSILVICGMLFQFGHPLKDIYLRLLSQAPKMQKEASDLHWKQGAILAQMIATITGYQAAKNPFKETDIMDPTFVEGVNGDHHQFILELICMYQYITGYLFGDLQTAMHAMEQIMSKFESRKGQLIEQFSHYYYYVLLLKEAYEEGSKQEKADALRKMKRCMQRLKIMASRSPENYGHKYLLAKAELARLMRKNPRLLERYYSLALDAARKNGHTHDVAIIAECIANYGIRSGNTFIARVYMNEAYDAYYRWGAFAKTADMEKKVGHLLKIKRESSDLERVDYISIVQSAQALSGEMEMSRLLHTVMRIMLKNAGAEYGALILIDEDSWVVEVYGTPEQLQIESFPLDQAEHLLPTAIIRYTARTKEELVIDDVASNDLFERLIYSKSKELKSMLCLPILHQNKLIGVLYMENNLSSGIFTKERVDVLKLLASQCAISITNAELFTGLEQLKNSLEDEVVKRTHALEKSMQATSEALAEATVYAERNRIAQEIHDIVGHTLTSTILQIEAGKRLLQKDMDSAVVRLKEAQELVRHSLNEIRNSVHMLKEDKYYNIVQALNQLIQETERNTGATIHAEIDPVMHLSLIQKKVLYHALQEGLTNGIRHGNSTEFDFTLRNEATSVQFRLADNGMGVSQIEMGFGLKMMRDRVEQLNGTLYIDSEPNKGCLLRIQIPHSV